MHVHSHIKGYLPYQFYNYRYLTLCHSAVNHSAEPFARKYNFSAYYRVPGINIHPFNGPLSETTRVSQYQKSKTNLDFTESRGSEWQWYQLGRVQVCTSLQTDNHTSTPPLSFLQARCPLCCPVSTRDRIENI